MVDSLIVGNLRIVELWNLFPVRRYAILKMPTAIQRFRVGFVSPFGASLHVQRALCRKFHHFQNRIDVFPVISQAGHFVLAAEFAFFPHPVKECAARRYANQRAA